MDIDHMSPPQRHTLVLRLTPEEATDIIGHITTSPEPSETVQQLLVPLIDISADRR